MTMDSIKAYILAHGLTPGSPLPTEAALCAELGVSRSSVREAMRRLEALDIVRSQRGSGSYVGDMSMRPLVETLVLRSALDVKGGASCARPASGESLLPGSSGEVGGIEGHAPISCARRPRPGAESP